MRRDHSEPVDSIPTPTDRLHRCTDLLNRRLLNLSADLDRIDATINEAIAEHLGDNTSQGNIEYDH